MKAGSAQKSVLNLLSTAIMLQLGRVHDGMMVDMVISNEKLLLRGQDIVATIAGCDLATAAAALHSTQNNIKLAVLVAMGKTVHDATALLSAHHGVLRMTIAALRGQ